MPVGRSATAAAQSDAPPRKPPTAIAANEKRILGPGCVNISASAAEMTKSAAVAGTKRFLSAAAIRVRASSGKSR